MRKSSAALVPITPRKAGGLSVVLLVIRAGDRLDEHAAPGPISLVVREGRIRFTTADGYVEAGPGTLLACDAAVEHAVEALGDVVRLISVATGGDTGNPG
jgi:quercetin dioxygenase-like cupin family protein